MQLQHETHHPTFPRLPLLGLGLAVLALALYGGLLRLERSLPIPSTDWLAYHGPLMVSGFMGTMIGVERAITLDRNWLYLGPLASLVGSGLFLAGIEPGLAGALLLTASGFLLLSALLISWRRPELHRIVMVLAAGSWFSGNLLWITGAQIPTIVLWWLGFIVLNFAGERLELTRLFRPSNRASLFLAGAVGLFLVGALWTVPNQEQGTRMASLGLASLAVWLALVDPELRPPSLKGEAGYLAVCLGIGYFWLFVSGAIGTAWAPHASGPAYDAFLHTVFLGYLFTMMFGHTAQMFEHIIQKPFAYLWTNWVHLVLLTGSLALRVVCDLGGWIGLRRVAGSLNALAIVLFFVSNGVGLWAGHRRAKRR